MENEVLRWRRRTMFLLSVVIHAVLIVILLVSPDLMARLVRLLGVRTQAEQQQPQITFLALPPDLEKLRKPPRTNTLSDQDRQTRGRSPLVNPFGNRMPFSRGNTPLPETAGGPKPTPPPAPAAPAPKPQSAGANEAAAKPPTPEKQEAQLKLEDVPAASSGADRLNLPPSSPGEAIQQSLQAAARGRGQYPGAGDSVGQFNNPNSNFSLGGAQVLSDTRGVNFGPYLRRVISVVRENWYNVIPESARLGEKGVVAIDFAIQPDGSVPDLLLSASSSSEALDRAAESGIHASTPFEPLPAEYVNKGGRELKLRFIFFYNETPP